MTQQTVDAKQLTKRTLIAFVILVVLFGLIYWFTKPVDGFNDRDPEVQAVIQAVVHFEEETTTLPTN